MRKGTIRKTVSFDWAIKYILRDKSNFEILEGFLTSLLKKDVKVIELIESEGNQSNESEKYNRVDILARVSHNEDVLIEVQYADELYFLKRLLFGASRDIVDNIKPGSGYEHVKKVYSVAIVYFNVEDYSNVKVGELTKNNLPKIATDYVIHGKTEFFGLHNNKPIPLNKKYLAGIQSSNSEMNIFPEYFIIPTETFPDKINDDLDEWIYMFKNNEIKAGFNAPGIDKAKESLAVVNMTPEEKKKYDDIEYAKGADKGVLDCAREDGFLKGKEEEREKADIEIAKEKKKAEIADKKAKEEKKKAEEEKKKAEEVEKQLQSAAEILSTTLNISIEEALLKIENNKGG